MSFLIWLSPWLIFGLFMAMTYLRFYYVAEYVLGFLILWSMIYPVIGIYLAQFKDRSDEVKDRKFD